MNPNPAHTASESADNQMHCRFCQSPVLALQHACPDCGFPQNGTLEEKKAFQERLRDRKDRFVRARKKSQSSLIALVILGMIFIVVGAIQWALSSGIAEATELYIPSIFNRTIGGFFLLCAGWGHKRNAFIWAALLTALGIFLAAEAVLAILDVQSVTRAPFIIGKSIVLLSLLYFLPAALYARKQSRFLAQNKVLVQKLELE